jgi:hypothetical protein
MRDRDEQPTVESGPRERTPDLDIRTVGDLDQEDLDPGSDGHQIKGGTGTAGKPGAPYAQ